MSKKEEELTVKQFSEKHKIPRSTVAFWCREGYLPGAHQVTTPFGDVWFIPKSVYDGFNVKTDTPVRGRPKQQKELKAA